MSNQTEELGGRLPLLSPQELAGAQRALYDKQHTTMTAKPERTHFQGMTADGRLIGPFNVSLFSPEIGTRFLDLQAAEIEHTTLDKRVRQVVVLAVGAVWKSHYELYAHVAVGRSVGLPEAAVQQMARGESPDGLSEPETLAYRYTHQLCAEHRVEADLYRSAEQTFGRQGLVDLAFLAGIYQTVCTLLNSFEVPAPDAQA